MQQINKNNPFNKSANQLVIFSFIYTNTYIFISYYIHTYMYIFYVYIGKDTSDITNRYITKWLHLS